MAGRFHVAWCAGVSHCAMTDARDASARPTRTLEQRRARLTAALRTLRDEPASPAGQKLARWLHTWRGLGAVAEGMAAQGYDLELQQYPRGWVARFYAATSSHASPAGTGWGAVPWEAVQEAARQALTVATAGAQLREQLATADATWRPSPAGGPAAFLRAKQQPPAHRRT